MNSLPNSYFLRSLLSTLMVISTSAINAQIINWPNPEVEQLYKSAQASLASGAFRQAIASYQQAIPLAPDEKVLYRDLSNAFLLSGNPERAEKTISPLIKNDRADPQTYAIAANIQIALKEEKKARRLLDQGIEKFPQSGYLYHERGKMYEEKDDLTEALRQWVAGIRAEPAYHINYYDAARVYVRTNKPVWAIIYGEIFVNLERLTPRSAETRKLLLAAYRRFYATPDAIDVKGFGKDPLGVAPKNFEEAVSRTLYKLAPVFTDGMSTENLTMLRTRFAMDWSAAYSSTYPFTLFQMHDNLLRSGHFDAYNQWVFGRADNPAVYDAWTKFHPKAIADYEAYYPVHPLQPTVADAYNVDISKKIFPQYK